MESEEQKDKGFPFKGQRDQHKYDEPDFGGNNHHQSMRHNHHPDEHGSVPHHHDFVMLSSQEPGHGADGSYFDNDHVSQTLRAAYSSILSSRGYNASIKIAPLYTQVTRNAPSNATSSHNETQNCENPVDRDLCSDPAFEDDDDEDEETNHSETEATSSISHKRHVSLEVSSSR